MYNSDEGRRRMALGITHYVYRNTKLEDYHSECVCMDKDFYRIIYRVVSGRLKNVVLLQRYLDDFREIDTNNKSDVNDLINSVPEELQLKFIRYAQEILFGSMYYGTNWDAAVELKSASGGQSHARYVLGGKFSECCDEGRILDDTTMCAINKDVHNRIYTLLVGGCFNK